ncbi:MAG: site-specific integrase [Nitrospiraceae bacterium]
MLVREVLHAYLQSSNRVGRRPTDQAHAQWWGGQLGDVPVQRLTHAQILGALKTLENSGRQHSTTAFYLRLLRRACAWGVQTGCLARDPCDGIPLPKERDVPIRVLTPEEERAIAESLGQPYALWMRFAILTGLRQSEQFSLRWRDVNVAGKVLLVPCPATGGIAEVALPDEALSILQELQRHSLSFLVFADPGNPTQPADVHQFYTTTWTNAVRKAGVPWVAWKDLRHTAGARLGAQGWPPDAIAGFLRHSDMKRAYLYRRWDPARQQAIQRKPKLATVHGDASSPAEFQAAILRGRTEAPFTFGELARLYAHHHLQDRPGRKDFDSLYQQCWTEWGDRLASTLTKREILAWHVGVSRTPGRANKGLAFLKSIFNWAARMDFIEDFNPARHIRKYRTEARERFLNVEELQALLSAFTLLSPKPRAYFILLLTTGGRLSEALTMRWKDLDLCTGVWTKLRTKNGRSHRVAIPKQAMEAIGALDRSSEWVFQGKHGRHWSDASAEKAWSNLRRKIGLDDVRIHDLRRTCASYLAQHGENLPVIQAVLNHASLQHVQIYARMDLREPRRALQELSDRFWLLNSGTPAKEVSPTLASVPSLHALPGLPYKSPIGTSPHKARTLSPSVVVEVQETVGAMEWPG